MKVFPVGPAPLTLVSFGAQATIPNPAPMFILRYPSGESLLRDLTYGLRPVQVLQEHRNLLLLKAPKEAILTSRLNRQITLYFVPDQERGSDRYVGMITAFFDDHDEPIVVWSPLYGDDEFTADLLTTFRQDSFELYFFDELNREVMGVRAGIRDPERFKHSISAAQFAAFDGSKVADVLERMTDWFSRRTSEDDESSFALGFQESLYPEDLVIIDAADPMDFQGSGGRTSINSLERDEPGEFQEREILRLLQRVFSGSALYLNPFWPGTNDEIADVLCFDGQVLIMVQAKDSPNTEQALRRSLTRKRSVIRRHIAKAARQLYGALSKVSGRESLEIATPEGVHLLAIADCIAIGLVVVREMFDDDYKACSGPVIETSERCGAPCILLAYSSLHEMTLHLNDPERFIAGLLHLFSVAQEAGEYPKLRFLGPPQPREDSI